MPSNKGNVEKNGQNKSKVKDDKVTSGNKRFELYVDRQNNLGMITLPKLMFVDFKMKLLPDQWA